MTNARAAEVLSMAVTFNGCGRATSDELKEAVSMATAASAATATVTASACARFVS